MFLINFDNKVFSNMQVYIINNILILVGGLRLDNKVLGGLILFFVIVSCIAGLMFFNSPNSQKAGANNSTISTMNQTTGNNTTFNSTNTELSLIPISSEGYNNQFTPIPNPNPGPNPTPDPMDHIISLFDAYLNKYYNQSLMPGMVVAIVKDGKIIYQNCFGVKDLASGAPVDENTLFGICSISKQFTSTNVAQLVDKGLMSWDDPISKYYSVPDEFQLYNDSYVSNNITIRDVLMHNSGLSRELGNEYPTYFNDSFSDAIFKLRYVKNTTPFRSTYAYNSLIYALAGYCAAKANNTTWNELIKDDLLIPLGMNTTVTSYWDFLNSPNHATPYKLLKNGTMVPYDIIPDPVGPAGSIYSSISEMANWLKFQVSDTGYFNGVKIVSKKELDETRTPQINITDPLDSVVYGSQYGLGWFIRANNPTLPYYVTHPGDSSDFHAQITVYPLKDLGIVILSNGGTYPSNFRSILDAKFRQLLAGNEDWDQWPDLKDALDATWKPDSPTPPLVDPMPLSGYVGVYSNNIYGNLTITSSNGALICNYGANNQSFNLEHFNGDVFTESYNDFTFNFTDISNNKADNLKVSLNDYTNAPANSTTIFNRTNSI